MGPDLWIGHMMPLDQEDGYSLVFKTWLKSIVSRVINCSLNDLQTPGGIPSSPDAVLLFILRIAIKTSSSVISLSNTGT